MYVNYIFILCVCFTRTLDTYNQGWAKIMILQNQQIKIKSGMSRSKSSFLKSQDQDQVFKIAKMKISSRSFFKVQDQDHFSKIKICQKIKIIFSKIGF